MKVCSHEEMEDSCLQCVLNAPKPPKVCPTCKNPTTYPKKDSLGLWTWACYEGCNP